MNINSEPLNVAALLRIPYRSELNCNETPEIDDWNALRSSGNALVNGRYN